MRHAAPFSGWTTRRYQKNEVSEASRSLSSVPGIRSSLAAGNIGTLTTDYDLIVDVTLDDVDSAGKLDHAAYKEATSLASANTSAADSPHHTIRWPQAEASGADRRDHLVDDVGGGNRRDVHVVVRRGYWTT